MAQVKLAYENVLEQNMTLLEMNRWCDSVKQAHMSVIVKLDDILQIKEEQIDNLKIQIGVNHDMFELANDQIKKERRLKWVFVGTTVVMAGFLTLSLL
jgi:ATP-dependent helicase/DNAse subunit B